MGNTHDIATLAGGCFWCLEAVFLEVNGIIEVVSGYTGGSTDSPSYEDICTGDTGHAEVVQIKFDTEVLGFQDVVNIFFSIHDPTTLNRQGNDIGTQYRSEIFYHDENQRQISLETIKKLNEDRLWPNPIVTEITQLGIFYRAEDYHQNYYRLNSTAPYCVAVIKPKLEKFFSK